VSILTTAVGTGALSWHSDGLCAGLDWSGGSGAQIAIRLRLVRRFGAAGFMHLVLDENLSPERTLNVRTEER